MFLGFVNRVLIFDILRVVIPISISTTAKIPCPPMHEVRARGGLGVWWVGWLYI